MRFYSRMGWRFRLAALAACLVALGAPALRGATGTRCLAVTGGRLVAAELARRDSRFLGMPADADLGYPPEPGERRAFSLPNGETVCIERASRTLGEPEILAALELPGTGSLGAEGSGDGVMAMVLDYPRTVFPEGKLRFPASGVSPPARGDDAVLWRGVIEYEPGRTAAIWARVRLSRRTKCLRAASDAAKGAVLPQSGIEEAACDAAGILAGALSPGSLAGGQGSRGRAAARAIRKGEWLTAELLTAAAMVMARREATLELRSGGVRLVLPVMPEESGSAGDTVWVRGIATRERLQARVAGVDSLTLTLPSRGAQRDTAAVASAETRPDGRTR